MWCGRPSPSPTIVMRPAIEEGVKDQSEKRAGDSKLPVRALSSGSSGPFRPRAFSMFCWMASPTARNTPPVTVFVTHKYRPKKIPLNFAETAI